MCGTPNSPGRMERNVQVDEIKYGGRQYPCMTMEILNDIADRGNIGSREATERSDEVWRTAVPAYGDSDEIPMNGRGDVVSRSDFKSVTGGVMGRSSVVGKIPKSKRGWWGWRKEYYKWSYQAGMRCQWREHGAGGVISSHVTGASWGKSLTLRGDGGGVWSGMREQELGDIERSIKEGEERGGLIVDVSVTDFVLAICEAEEAKCTKLTASAQVTDSHASAVLSKFVLHPLEWTSGLQIITS
ncbi:hypothetical protein BC826DRAFT_968199 [Russula brevipes]|nr:hypothetical protein BC826DRAFT_968199 [Russula brevipes]